MNAPASYSGPVIVLDGSNEALAVMLAIEAMTRNVERRKRAQETQAA